QAGGSGVDEDRAILWQKLRHAAAETGLHARGFLGFSGKGRFGKREVRRQQSAMRAARQAGSAKFGSITTRGRLGHSEVRTNFRERQAALLGEQAKNGAVTFRSEHATVEAGVRCLTNGNAHNRSNRARAIARVLGFVLLRGSRVIRFADGWAAIAARGGGGQGDPRHVRE